MKNYEEFLNKKIKEHQESGFDIDENKLNKNLFDFQKFIIKQALKKGKYAIFANTGLGKTIMQLEWAYQVLKYTNKSVLILCPLAVTGQTKKEGEKFGIEINKICNDNYKNNIGIYITNYEQLDNIDELYFDGIVLDESSILKNFTGEIKKKLIDKFDKTLYKLACTATPSPNDPMELGNHSEFLNIMSRDEMLSMYFIHDGGETSKWKLKGHSKKHFWNFISTWAIMLINPSDIGFIDDGIKFRLPELKYHEYKIITEKRDNGLLFNEVSINATNFNSELRLTIDERMNKVLEIINKNPNENFIIWIKQNEEGKLLKKLIPSAIEVKGDDNAEYKEKMLLGFANNEFKILITKTKIAQFGLNYQNCHNQIFASLDFSFEGLYQAIRRSYRFGQTNTVNIHLITTDTMSNVIQSIDKKERLFNEMQNQMVESTKRNVTSIKLTKIDYDVKSIEHEKYTIKNGDSIELIQNLDDNSIDFSIFSPPFADLYTYSDKINDLGNCKNHNEFIEHFEFLVKDLHRVLKDGRLVAVHCMDLPILKSKEGFIGLRDFSGMLVKLFTDNGFIYHDRITIWKDPVIEMQRTKALGLLHKQLKKDSSMSRTGTPDYLIVFRKDGINKEPIENTSIPVDLWQQYASPIWLDINYTKTLQYLTAKDNNDQKHICPLQLETIERAITLWSNKNDIIFSPFMGIGSEGYQSLKMDRKFIGFELKESYFNLAIKNMELAITESKQLSFI